MLRTQEFDRSQVPDQDLDQEWGSFPGGELEGKRPRTLCSACRDRLRDAARAGDPGQAGPRPLCFQCYRAGLDRERALAAAGTLFTGSEARFQEQLPLEPVDRIRLEALRTVRRVARATLNSGPDRFAERRHAAQIAARHRLAEVADGLRMRRAVNGEAVREMSAALRAAEQQLPESWLPFVVSG